MGEKELINAILDSLEGYITDEETYYLSGTWRNYPYFCKYSTYFDKLFLQNEVMIFKLANKYLIETNQYIEFVTLRQSCEPTLFEIREISKFSLIEIRKKRYNIRAGFLKWLKAQI